METNYLTIEQVAERYDRSAAAVRVWAQRGELPGAFKPHPRLWLVDAARLSGFEPPRRGRPTATRESTATVP